MTEPELKELAKKFAAELGELGKKYGFYALGLSGLVGEPGKIAYPINIWIPQPGVSSDDYFVKSLYSSFLVGFGMFKLAAGGRDFFLQTGKAVFIDTTLNDQN